MLFRVHNKTKKMFPLPYDNYGLIANDPVGYSAEIDGQPAVIPFKYQGNALSVHRLV